MRVITTIFAKWASRARRAAGKWQPLLAYSALALAILGPLLLPGYVLTLDMVFTPYVPAPDYVSSSYLLRLLLHWLAVVLPADVVQKLLLLVIFVLAGWGMHRLVTWIDTTYGVGNRLKAPALYFAGLFYVVNPFTYDRLMAGQYAVLLGYACLPWCFRALLALVARPAWATAWPLLAWMLALSIVSIHAIAAVLVLAVATLGWGVWRCRSSIALLRRLGLWAGGVAAAWVLLSSYWLVPLLAGKDQTSATVASFTAADRLAFQTVGVNPLERLANVVGMQGFWAEQYSLYRLPQEYVPSLVWQLCVVLFLCLVLAGGVALWRRHQRGLLAAMALPGLLGVVLAAGIGLGWLSANVPLFAGYREPQKLAMLAVLAYGVLAAYGADALLGRMRQYGRLARVAGLGAVLLLPYMLAPVMPWGAVGQLRPVHYPAGWEAVRAELVRDGGGAGVLVLPWHLYLKVDFARRVVANPAPGYFATAGSRVFSSADPEIKGAAQARPTTAVLQAEQLVRRALQTKGDSFAQGLAGLDIGYIVLTKNTDFQDYAFLDGLPGLERIYDDEDISLYRNYIH